MGQPLKHLANEVFKGVMTHVVDPNSATERSESWNVTVQRTRTPIFTDSPSEDRVYAQFVLYPLTSRGLK